MTQVLFAHPEEAQIHWLTEVGDYSGQGLVAPAKYEFEQGWLYQLRLSNIPHRDGVVLYPVLEIAPTPKMDERTANRVVPIEFTAEDFDQVLSGISVTKVLFYPNPDFMELAMAGINPSDVHTFSSTDFPAGLDPLLAAAPRGTILAVLHLASGDRELHKRDGIVDRSQATNSQDPQRPMRYPTAIFSEAQFDELRQIELSRGVQREIFRAKELLNDHQAIEAIEVLKRTATIVAETDKINIEKREELQRDLAFATNICVTCLAGEPYQRLQHAQLLLAEPTSVAFTESPLSEVCEFLSDFVGDPIIIDAIALEKFGLGTDAPVTIDIEVATLREVLDQLVGELGLCYRPTKDGLEITTLEKDKAELANVSYPVIDLTSGPNRIAGDRLVSLIKKNVEPERWKHSGGNGLDSGGIEYAPERNLLLVKQSWSVHFRLDDFLWDLREIRPLGK